MRPSKAASALLAAALALLSLTASIAVPILCRPFFNVQSIDPAAFSEDVIQPVNTVSEIQNNCLINTFFKYNVNQFFPFRGRHVS